MPRAILKGKAISFRLDIFDSDEFAHAATAHGLSVGQLAEKLGTCFVRDPGMRDKVFKAPTPPRASNPLPDAPVVCDHPNARLIKPNSPVKECPDCGARGAWA